MHVKKALKKRESLLGVVAGYKDTEPTIAVSDFISNIAYMKKPTLSLLVFKYTLGNLINIF